MISDFYSIPIGNVKTLVLNFFDEKYVSLWTLATLLNARIKGCCVS